MDGGVKSAILLIKMQLRIFDANELPYENNTVLLVHKRFTTPISITEAVAGNRDIREQATLP